MRLRTAAIAVVLSAAFPLLAGYVTQDAWVVVAGHATGIGGRQFETTVYMTDASHSMNDVTLSFFPAGEPVASPRSITLQLGPDQSGAIDVGPQLTGDAGAIGALRIHSTGSLLAEAHLFNRTPAEAPPQIGEVLNAIPAQYAIGSGDFTVVPVHAGARYKLYAVETNGFPLYFSVASGTADRRLLIRPHEERSWDLAQVLPVAQVSSLRITGINGSGKIIVLGTAVAEHGKDFSAYEMMLPARARHRMTWPEMTAYAAVAVAIAFTAFYRMWSDGRSRPSTREDARRST
ncbi:MAG TPA: hypothetical protein VLU46_08775 [Thermoanaerobaculia bacterium]|nr:hypothetical protein [Thermoanaerobaculia bacterium]